MRTCRGILQCTLRSQREKNKHKCLLFYGCRKIAWSPSFCRKSAGDRSCRKIDCLGISCRKIAALPAGGTRSLVRQRSKEKHQCQLGIGLLRQDHLPAKRCSRPQRCVKPELCVLSCKDSGEKNAEQAFLRSSCL